MTKEAKVAVVVVTFNRKDMLIDCLKGILGQTRPVDKVFLIDNGSTDGTRERIQELYQSDDRLTYILNENTGSAGGFNEGAKRAYAWGADWIWFLDDDVLPDPDCLEKLLEYQYLSKCLHPSKHDIEGKEFIWENTYDPAMVRVAIFTENISFKNGKDIAFVHIGCFEGMCIHREIVEKIGFPDPRFFSAGDDVMYGFLASLHTNVSFLKKAHITRLVPFSKNTITPRYLYYATRNQFLLKEYSKRLGLFKGRLFYPYLLWFVLYASLKQMFRNRSLKTPWYMWRGIIDGLRGRFYKL